MTVTGRGVELGPLDVLALQDSLPGPEPGAFPSRPIEVIAFGPPSRGALVSELLATSERIATGDPDAAFHLGVIAARLLTEKE